MLRKEIAGLVLAGGSNRRFPYLKSFIQVEGRFIIERQLEFLSEYFNEVMISTNMPERYFKFGAKLVGDIYKSCGPLTGILSAMLNTNAGALFIMACDMPFVRKEVANLILSRKKKSKIVICEFDSKLQPLLGLYDCSLLPEIEKFLLSDNIRILDFIEQTDDFYIIKEDELKEIDPKGCSFVNINTPEEYNKYIGGKICLD